MEYQTMILLSSQVAVEMARKGLYRLSEAEENVSTLRVLCELAGCLNKIDTLKSVEAQINSMFKDQGINLVSVSYTNESLSFRLKDLDPQRLQLATKRNQVKVGLNRALSICEDLTRYEKNVSEIKHWIQIGRVRGVQLLDLRSAQRLSDTLKKIDIDIDVQILSEQVSLCGPLPTKVLLKGNSLKVALENFEVQKKLCQEKAVLVAQQELDEINQLIAEFISLKSFKSHHTLRNVSEINSISGLVQAQNWKAKDLIQTQIVTKALEQSIEVTVEGQTLILKDLDEERVAHRNEVFKGYLAFNNFVRIAQRLKHCDLLNIEVIEVAQLILCNGKVNLKEIWLKFKQTFNENFQVFDKFLWAINYDHKI